MLFLIFYSNCAMIPELNPYRYEKIARGPKFALYDGLKKRIAVLDFENHSSFGDQRIGSAFSDMLISQLARSGRFILVERSEMEQILKEQVLGQAGMLTEESAPQVGRLLGAESIITGRILNAGQETGAHKFDDKKKDWGFALKATVGFVHVSYRMISTETGEIIAAGNVSKKEIRPGLAIKTEDFDFDNLFDFDQTVVGIAFHKAVNKIALDIVKSAGKIEWRGKVVQCSGDSIVYFTPGQISGVKINQIFNIYDNPNFTNDAENQIQKPEYLNRPKARVKVIGFIGDKVARARIIMGGYINRGDLVKFVHQSPGLPPERKIMEDKS